ncbi:PREDICTED: nucleolar protein 58 [Vollenhovia emeryi]|uniref:nucleolar protein 58 n=1 Tax=Vollenhovia emeryi TaxID=411798 RepID=UPI0005F3882E|nr:PREDICTED: nucleolar protein 58 [Vollenhovia emeryi]
MLVLFETPAGYAIFKLMDESKLAKSDNLYIDFETPEAARKLIKLKYFHKFEDTTEALAATTAIVDGKLSKSLKRTLRNSCTEAHEQLAVADARLGSAIKDKLSLSCVSNTAVQELMRCIRSQRDELITEVTKKEMTAMALGLAHSLSRYKLKFSPDKIDTMVIQAVCLLDDLDKELNNYIMRAREWYGWHFPELGKIVTDNLQYIQTMKTIGRRENAVSCDLSDILIEDVEGRVKEAAETSMGSEISEYDAEHMRYLCVEILELHRYRGQLSEYLSTRMTALAPNLSILVGDLIGARLIAKAGSLTNLAKHPASTLQILGAEKALFRALKSKKNTPKYGLIYHSQLVGQSSNRNKGKMSRMLAAKASLATRVDALGDSSGNLNSNEPLLGAKHRATLQERLNRLEEGNIRRISGTAKAKAKFEKYHSKNECMQYPASADSTLQTQKRPLIEEIIKQENEAEEEEVKVEVPKKKKKKHSTNHEQTEEAAQAEIESAAAPAEQKKKKKKKKDKESEEAVTVKVEEQATVSVKVEDPVPSEKKKKKHNVESYVEQGEFSGAQAELVTPKKKKKRSMEIKTEDVEEASQEVQIKPESGAIPKKKKKYSVEPENTEELNDSLKRKKKRSIETKTEDTGEFSGMQEAEVAEQKKKKKKKKDKESEEMQQMTASVEEVEEPVSSEKKKKKKKSKQD